MASCRPDIFCRLPRNPSACACKRKGSTSHQLECQRLLRQVPRLAAALLRVRRQLAPHRCQRRQRLGLLRCQGRLGAAVRREGLANQRHRRGQGCGGRQGGCGKGRVACCR